MIVSSLRGGLGNQMFIYAMVKAMALRNNVPFAFNLTTDFANDEVLEVIEEIIESLDLEGEMMAFQMTEKTSDYVQFMALFTEEESNVAIEEVVREYLSK